MGPFYQFLKTTLDSRAPKLSVTHCDPSVQSRHTTSTMKAGSHSSSSTSRPFTIAVEGNIGAGKSTFLDHFAKVESVQVLPEPVAKWQDMGGHNLLELQYSDPERWSHLVQSYIQLTMAENHTAPLSGEDKKVKMLERSIQSSRHCFIQNFRDTGKMSEAGYKVLVEWFEFLTARSTDMDVDMFIYLRTTPEVAYQRVQERARKEEEVVPLAYLKQVHDLHEKWIKSIQNVPVLIVDANQDVTQVPDIYSRHEADIFSNLHKNSPKSIVATPEKAPRSPRKALANMTNASNRVIGSV